MGDVLGAAAIVTHCGVARTVRTGDSRGSSFRRLSADAIEGFAALDRHVIVRQSSEVIDLADRPTLVAGETTVRAAAFTRLADEHLDRAYRLARAILRDEAEAQDATHDAFVQAWRKWDTLRDLARFEAWFDRILVNACRDRLRSPRRQATDISAEVALSTRDHAGPAEDRAVLGQAISALSPDHQVVVALRFYRDMTIEDIAARLGIPAGTVQSRLHYALKRLHEAIDAGDSKGTQR
jgi:RNA polymerase sigma-70 factor, ECF subfamily